MAAALGRAAACGPVGLPLRQGGAVRAGRCRPRPAAAARRRHRPAALQRPEDEIEPVPPALVSSLGSEDELLEEAQWVSDMVRCWANEEWAAQELFGVHAELGEAVGQAYLKLRRQEGVSEMGDLVLGLATELMTGFDFGPTFTSPFDVANKTTELLMLRGGVSCSCSDEGAIERYEAQLAAERSS